MKHLLLFLLFKALEIGAVVFIPYFVGMLVDNDKAIHPRERWLMGLAHIIVLVVVVPFIVFVCCRFILLNWQWAGRF